MTRLVQRLSVAVAAVIVVAGAVEAQERRTPSYRPYIVEVGPARAIGIDRFEEEMQLNSDLRSWVRSYGYPDVAEIQPVTPQYGWAPYEIRAFYLARNQEIAFGRIAFFPTTGGSTMVQGLGLVKYEGDMQRADRQRVEMMPRLCAGGGGNSLDRILAAADRATRAAEIAERESLSAVASAERAEAAVGRLESGFKSSLRK